MTVPEGTELGGRYRLEERLAGGGMGEVWRARDLVLQRAVAVKVLRREYADDARFLERFRSEARHMAALSHPGIAGVYDYGESDGAPYLVMELVEGEPLSALLAREQRLTPARVMQIVGETAFALQAAHEAGVIHRDVKPGNILVRTDGAVKVTDFGIARAAGASTLTQTGTVVGTAHYLSPEQAEGRPVTARSDVYALGVVAFECLSGERPFVADTPIAVAMSHVRATPPPLPPDVPQEVRDLVGRAMTKDAAARFHTAGELGRAALALATEPAMPTDTTRELPVEADPRTELRPFQGSYLPGQRRVRNRMILAGLLVVVVGGVVLWLLAPAGRAEVPQVGNLQVQQATARLQDAGFAVRTRTVHDARHPAGTVVAEHPAAHSTQDKGSTVTVTVASGPRSVTVRSADYVGRPLTEVQAALQQAGLTVRPESLLASDPPGTVLALSPTGSVQEGTTIVVTVAESPPPAPAPDKGKGKGHRNE